MQFILHYYLLLLFLFIYRCIKELQNTKEEHKKATAETERLLKLVQMSQEEQNAKEKTIMDLQQYVENNKKRIFIFS